MSHHVAERVRQRRTELRMTKGRLAKAADISVSVIVDIERKPGGSHPPRTVTVDDLVKLAKALDTTPEWLLGSYSTGGE